MVTIEVCGNCNRQIGRLENPFLYEGSVVCAKCYHQLADEVPVEQMKKPYTRSFSVRRILLVLAVVAGIVGIILLLAEWQRRIDLLKYLQNELYKIR